MDQAKMWLGGISAQANPDFRISTSHAPKHTNRESTDINELLPHFKEKSLN